MSNSCRRFRSILGSETAPSAMDMGVMLIGVTCDVSRAHVCKPGFGKYRVWVCGIVEQYRLQTSRAVKAAI